MQFNVNNLTQHNISSFCETKSHNTSGQQYKKCDAEYEKEKPST